jgi:2-phospho-L-lactate transferase/gluconeogenesis factor (CofD/UPF0052 family)
MTYPSQSDNFAVSDHVRLLGEYIGRPVDYVLVNSVQPPQEMIAHYNKRGSDLVVCDPENIK